MVIKGTDRVAKVLERDEDLIEVFAMSPALSGLRRPLLRRTMGKLATVEQVARVAGLAPELLVERLNRALADRSGEDDGPTATSGADVQTGKHPDERKEMSTTDTDAPAALVAISPDRVVDVDVRQALREGKEPFSEIMAARRTVEPGGVLRVRAIFEPAPLYAVLAKQGFAHWTEKLAEDDWRVWFYSADATEPATASTQRPSPEGAEATKEADRSSEDDEDVVVLDVRGMEPPEPLVMTLAALENLPPGKTLLHINERVPQFLLPRLTEAGFVYEVREQKEGVVRVFIRRPTRS